METLTRASLPRIPQFSIPFLNQFFGTQSWWTRSFCTSRSITIETHSTFMFPLVLPLCGNIKVSSTHQPDERPFLFHPPPFSDPRRDRSTSDLASGACSRTAAACNFNGRRRCSRFLMAPSSSSSPISGGESGDDTGEEVGKYGEEAEMALGMDENIPGGSCEFLHRVSSRAYDMRRNLLQTIDSSSYEVLQQNPWREDSKPVFVLTQQNNQLFTMKTRQSCSEVERELGLLFTRREKLDKQDNSKTKHPGTEINMLVEDIREGVLVFEDESEASRYCELLEGGGHKCEGIAELEVSSVFDICQKMRALAVLFRRGRTPPLPESLQQNLRARKRSLEDQD